MLVCCSAGRMARRPSRYGTPSGEFRVTNPETRDAASGQAKIHVVVEMDGRGHRVQNLK